MINLSREDDLADGLHNPPGPPSRLPQKGHATESNSLFRDLGNDTNTFCPESNSRIFKWASYLSFWWCCTYCKLSLARFLASCTLCWNPCQYNVGSQVSAASCSQSSLKICGRPLGQWPNTSSKREYINDSERVSLRTNNTKWRSRSHF